jgi:hypothetical protein
MPTFNQNTSVNLAGTQLVNLQISETVPPSWSTAFGGTYSTVGQQSTPKLARGIVENTGVGYTNSTLSHSCDISFVFAPGAFPSLSGLTLDLSPLIAAIQNGKLRAAAVVRAALVDIAANFRIAINAAIEILGLDPTGEISYAISKAKAIFRKINQTIKDIAQVVEDISYYYFLIQDIQQIIAWIASLPEKVKAMLQGCLTNFTNSIQNVVNQVSSIPGQIAAGVQGTTTSFTQNLTSQLNSLQQAASTNVTINPSISNAVSGSTNVTDLQSLKDYITSNAPSQASIQAKSIGNQMSSAKQP